MKGINGTNGISGCHKFLFEGLLNLLDSDTDDDDSEDDQPEKAEQQIVTDKEHGKVDTQQCKDDLYDLSIPQYKFPYEDYRIIGDTSEIEKVVQTCGMINIDVADITSILSTDTMNYVTIGFGGNIVDAMKQSIENLPVATGDVANMLFQILVPKNTAKGCQSDLPAINQLSAFLKSLPFDIGVIWGIAYDETLTDNIKVILIASSK